ncbi:MAG: hypothetical protein ACI4B5_03130 [Bacteroidaceae bacterium]
MLKITLLATVSMALTSCIDNSYDATDVDLTIGLGTDGLKLKLGNTEKIYLKDIIETDSNVKTDDTNCFYLTEKGSADISYQVDEITSDIDKIARVKCKHRVLSWNEDLWKQMGKQDVTEITIPADYSLHGTAEGENKSDYTAEDIGEEVKRITRVYPRDFGADLVVSMICSESVQMGIEKLQDFSVTLPQYVHLREIPQGWTLSGSTLTYKGEIVFDTDTKTICSIYIDYIDLKEEGIPTNGKVTLSQEMTRVAMNGTAYFKARNEFVMRNGDYADIMLDICFHNDGEIIVDSIQGFFDPNITPDIEPVSIYDKMPEYLRNEDTKILVSNTTLKFEVDMNTIPADIFMGATLTSVKNGQGAWSQEVVLPQVTMRGGHGNTAYFHQTGIEPYDPEGQIPADAIVQQVPDLCKLMERIPDVIEVDMTNKKVTLAQKEVTLGMGKTYRSQVNYKVFAPLVAEEGFCIAYRDSSNSISSDLEDIQAKGLRLSTTIENTVPLSLTMSIKATDSLGREIPGIHFTQAKAQAGQGEASEPTRSDVIMEASLENPKDIQLIDRIVFEVKAEQNEKKQAKPLTSEQYIRLTEIRLRLTGGITVDMN